MTVSVLPSRTTVVDPRCPIESREFSDAAGNRYLLGFRGPSRGVLGTDRAARCSSEWIQEKHAYQDDPHQTDQRENYRPQFGRGNSTSIARSDACVIAPFCSVRHSIHLLVP